MNARQHTALSQLFERLSLWDGPGTSTPVSTEDFAIAARALREAFTFADGPGTTPSPELTKGSQNRTEVHFREENEMPLGVRPGEPFERRVLQRIDALAGDLLEMLVSQGAESEDKVRFYDAAELPSLAAYCREAAEIAYGRSSIGHGIDPNGAIDPAFHAEILRQHAVMEGIIERLDTDVESRLRRWGGAIGADPATYFARDLGCQRPLGQTTPEPSTASDGGDPWKEAE